MNYIYRDELYHHGIKGQKWGIRRYQNEDGSYTNAGKERRNGKVTDLSSDDLIKKARALGANPGPNTRRLQRKVKKYESKRDAALNRISKKEGKVANSYNSKIENLAKKKNIKVLTDQDYEHGSYTNKESSSYVKFLGSKEVEAIRNSRDTELGKLYASASYKKLESDARRWENKADRISLNKGLWNGALLKDLGYEDTKGGRAYIEKVIYGRESKQKTAEESRFERASKDHPGLTYDAMYKEMGINMESEDPDDYRNAEAEWYKKHGY